MAQDDPTQLPQVLQLHFLKAWDSPLPQPQVIHSHATSVQVLLSTAFEIPITAQLLQLLPSLKLLIAPSAGLNHVDLAACRARGVRMANSPSIFAADVADMAVGLFLDVMGKISAANRFVRDGFWVSRGDFVLDRREASIVGLGCIGLEVAKRLEAFDCKILYNSRKESDVLVICCVLTAQTRHMINKKILLALGREGVIVNVGHGAIIDEKEMVQCLVQGEIRGAGLDVFGNEPEVRKKLFGLDNVVLSPHKAALTADCFTNLTDLAMANLEAFFSNKP
ncbi:glyoxylate/hydroxypyruvate reductase HPR3-like [Pyrus ussuriensis x Pyrus communis]|uniref:Glyoxylate/hydroxypyruvate reductase HPR3-like n=1 Tax=Pyrus ussuriensis x Pyrus communis TaxID=2448454 RepID=A0A5N5GBC0_9ROSA|nr:glyoxylate/hydroxypyruvate reductase HPR3-like [Pyrus ussuriensis x Pyrus communis]